MVTPEEAKGWSEAVLKEEQENLDKALDMVVGLVGGEQSELGRNPAQGVRGGAIPHVHQCRVALHVHLCHPNTSGRASDHTKFMCAGCTK